MKYNKDGEFDIYELFNNEKYRARLVLSFYAILIAILIITLRTGSTSNTKNDNTDKNPAITENDDEDENDDDDEDEDEDEEDKENYENRFVYVLQNNYEFDYKLTTDKKIVDSKGKRTDKETLFDVISDGETTNCYGKDDTLMCKINGKYTETDYPYLFFNYYDPKEVVELLNESTFNEKDNKYHIDNVTLYSFGDGSIDLSKIEKEDEKKTDNTIELIEKNGKVVGVKMDFSNFFNFFFVTPPHF